MLATIPIGALQGTTASEHQGSVSEHELALVMMKIVEIPRTMALRPLRTQTWLLLSLASQQHEELGQGRRVTAGGL
jgi:hypothetical protein